MANPTKRKHAMEEFRGRQSELNRIAKTWEKILSAVASKLGLIKSSNVCSISARVKRPASLAEKLIKKSYSNPMEQVTDLVGLRVVLEQPADVDSFCDEIQRMSQHGPGKVSPTLRIDWENSNMMQGAEKPDVFGYRSSHIIATIRTGVKEINGVNVRRIRGITSRRVEIQIRTLLQQAWANEAHSGVYKATGKAPDELKRDYARLAAALESADNAFATLRRNTQFYQLTQLSHRSPQEICDEISDIKKSIRNMKKAKWRRADVEPLLIREAKNHAALGEWGELLKLFYRNVQSTIARGFERNERAWKDKAQIAALTGIAWRHLRNNQSGSPTLNRKSRIVMALRLLEMAQIREPNNAMICCELGDLEFLEASHRNAKLDGYRRALERDPEHPRAVRSMMLARLIQSNLAMPIDMLLPMARRGYESAIRLAQGALYLPWAYFDAAFFMMLIEVDRLDGREDEPYFGIDAMGFLLLGICTCVHDGPMLAVQHWIEKMLACSLAKSSDPSATLQNSRLRNLLWQFHVTIIMGRYSRVRRLIQAAGLSRKRMKEEVKRLRRSKERDRSVQIKRMTDGISEIDKRLKQLGELRRTLPDGVLRRAFQGGANVNAKESAIVRAGSVFANASRVVVLAGTSLGEGHGSYVKEYGDNVEFAFRDYRDVFVRPASDVGVGALASRIRRQMNSDAKVAYYLPSGLATKGRKPASSGDTVIPVPAKDWSAHDPITMWVHLVLSGVKPENVRLLGIGGGKIARFEYQLAAVLGANVGILAAAGREGEKLLNDSAWKDARIDGNRVGLFALPFEKETLRAFVTRPANWFSPGNASRSLKKHGSPAYKVEGIDTCLKNPDIESLAILIHARYMESKLGSIGKDDPSTKPWSSLEETYRESNRAQALHYAETFRAGGFELLWKEDKRDEAVEDEVEFLFDNWKEFYTEYRDGEELSSFKLSMQRLGKKIGKVETERLRDMAKHEHARWNVERLCNGWRHQRKTDKPAKLHDSIVPWDDLDINTKKFDVFAVLGMYDNLIGEGSPWGLRFLTKTSS